MYDFGVHAETKSLVRASAFCVFATNLEVSMPMGHQWIFKSNRRVIIIGKYEVGDMYLSQTPYTI